MNIVQKAWQAVTDSVKGEKAYTGVPNYLVRLGADFTGDKFRNKTGQLSLGYRNKIVYATVNVLVSKLVEAPILVSKESNKNAVKKLNGFNFKGDANKSGKYNVLKVKALEEVESHDLIDLLDTPNEYQTGIELRTAFWYNYELTGDGYLYVEMLGDKPVFLHVLPSDRVTPHRATNADWRTPATHYVFNAWDGTKIDISPSEIMHLAKWSPLDPLGGGFSPQMAVGETISKNNANEAAQGAAFMNGGTGTIISSDVLVDNAKTYSKLTVEQVNSIKDTVKQEMTGVHNAQKIHVTNGYVNVQKLGDTLVDLNAIAADDQDAQRIASAWGVNPILIGDMNKGTESNVQAAYKALVTNVVIAKLRLFDAKFRQFSKDWHKKERLHVMHDLTEFSELAPDLKLMKEVFGDVPWLTYNEKRKLFNFDEGTEPNLNRYIIPMGLQFLEDIGVDPMADIDTPDSL